MGKRVFEKRMDKLWKGLKRDLNRVSQDTIGLVKKGEARVKDISKKAEDNLEVMVFSLQREKLYYELGKYLANLSKSKWANSKKAESFLIRIKKFNREIKSLKEK